MATRKPENVPPARDLPASVDDIVTAQRQGRDAAHAGDRITACPYGAESDREKFLQLMWARAYRAELI